MLLWHVPVNIRDESVKRSTSHYGIKFAKFDLLFCSLSIYLRNKYRFQQFKCTTKNIILLNIVNQEIYYSQYIQK